MSRIKIILATLLWLPVLSQGQQRLSLTLQQAIKTGIENSKPGKISQAKLDIANAKYDEATDAVLPSLKVAAGYTRQSDITPFMAQFPGATEPVTFFPNIPNLYSARASLTENVFTGFRLKYAMESQRLLQQAAKLDLGKEQDEAAYLIAGAYYNLYKIYESKKAVAENLEQVKQHVYEIHLMTAQGVATRNDELKWEMQQSNIEIAQLEIENTMKVANYNMNLMLGMNGDVMIDVDTNSIVTVKEEKALADYMQLAATNRNDLLALDARTKAAGSSFHVVKNSTYPTIGLGANYAYARPNARIFPLQDVFKNTWDVGINVSWDLTNLYSSKHNVAEAKALIKQSEEMQNQLSDAVKMEVNQSYISYLESKQKMTMYEKALEQADENYRITDSKFKNNVVLQSDLIDASTALLQAKINIAVAKADTEIAYNKLLKAMGTIY